MLAFKRFGRAVAVPSYGAGCANMHAVHACTVLVIYGKPSFILQQVCRFWTANARIEVRFCTSA